MMILMNKKIKIKFAELLDICIAINQIDFIFDFSCQIIYNIVGVLLS